MVRSPYREAYQMTVPVHSHKGSKLKTSRDIQRSPLKENRQHEKQNKSKKKNQKPENKKRAESRKKILKRNRSIVFMKQERDVIKKYSEKQSVLRN